MLLQAGLSFRRLLLLSLVSGGLGLGGAALGVGLSRGPVPLTPWVFGVTAGVFLYVALVDMVRCGIEQTIQGQWAGGCGGEGSASPSTSTSRSGEYWLMASPEKNIQTWGGGARMGQAWWHTPLIPSSLRRQRVRGQLGLQHVAG